jgi:dimethylhistidine N-methyltransferase
LRRDYPDVAIHPLVADFTAPFAIPSHFLERDDEKTHRKMIFFPGSTISNFTPEEARPFLRRLRDVLSEGDYLFIGVDRIKDRERLERAYDDAQGVTAAFNLNLLERIDRELDTDLDPQAFEHRALYNGQKSRIEMHLDSRHDQTFSVCGHRISFREGESIHTENSYKYSPEGFVALARSAGFDVTQTFSDKEDLFSLYLCRVFS